MSDSSLHKWRERFR